MHILLTVDLAVGQPKKTFERAAGIRARSALMEAAVPRLGSV